MQPRQASWPTLDSLLFFFNRKLHVIGKAHRVQIVKVNVLDLEKIQAQPSHCAPRASVFFSNHEPSRVVRSKARTKRREKRDERRETRDESVKLCDS